MIKAIFEELVRKIGVLPGEIVYSDDDESKMDGAKELGINTFVKHLENLDVKI